MKLTKLLAAIGLSLFAAAGAFATIGAGLQLQLGNPTGATVDPTNHNHYLLQRGEYALDYSDNNGEPNWVAWDLTTDDLGAFPRSNNFIPDPDLPTSFYALVTGDYTGSGYDRGHMCPSADRTITAESNQATFILSNILPQAPDNNQGVWANFETYCRDEAKKGNEMLITSGGSVFSGSRILSGKAAIPGYTWKIVLEVPLGAGSAVSRITASTRIIAIKIPNIAGVRSIPWTNFVTSAAQIEADTGFTFLTDLPAPIAAVLRNVVDGQSAAGAPQITSQPAPQTTIVGGTATFSVSATGDEPLSYQWFHDDDDIPGATSASFTLSSVQAADAGNYYVTVTNPVSSATSNAAALVILGLPPTITTPPQSQTVNAGANVTFSVSAGGSPPLTYQWRKGGVPIASANASSFTLQNVQSGDAGSYDVVVTNSINFATSAPATLLVNPAVPTITGQPASRTAATGDNTSFTVVASGSAPLTYQWRKEGVPLVDGGVYSGTTTATLLLTNVSVTDGANYDVVVSNSLGFVPSNAATLTVNPPLPSTVTWTFAAADGTPTADPTSGLTADITGGTFFQRNNNGTTPLLTTTSASTSGFSGTYNAGAATFNGALHKDTSTYFEFTLAPSGGKRLLATKISFGSRSTGTGPIAFDVYSSLDGFNAPVTTGTFASNSTWKQFSLDFDPVTGATGQPLTFRIYGYGGTGAVGSTAVWRVDDVKLTVSAVFPPPVAPVVTAFTPGGTTAAIAIATPITITFNEAVAFEGSWFSIVSAGHGPMSATVTGGPTTFTLTPPSNFANSDVITVTIFGAQIVDQASGTIHGTEDKTFSFRTQAFVPPTPPSITTEPVAQTVAAGTNVTFTVAASGTTPLLYQWRKGGTPISGNSSATTASLVLPNVTGADAGSYDCVVTNVAGSDVSHVAALLVNLVPPSIVTPPVAQSAVVGGSATFTVVAAGSAPLSYRWRKGGTPLVDGARIAGATTASLALTALVAGDIGDYDVVVTNAANSATSSTAALIVTAETPSTIYWDFATASPTSGVPAGLTGGAVTQGNNNGTTALLTTTSASTTYAGASGGNNIGAAARVGALNQNAAGSAYFEFTFTPPVGQKFGASGLRFGARSTGTGPQAIAIFSSVDGFAAPVAATTVNADSVWRLITPPFKGVTGAAGSAVTFRIFGYNGLGGASANTANWRLDDLQLTGGLLAAAATAPVVTSTSPVAGATGVLPGAAITISFNEAVNVSGSWYTVTGATSGAIAASASGGPQSFTLTPTSALPAGETITVKILAAKVVDQATGLFPLAADYTFSFATALPLAPMIVTPPASQTVTVGDTATFSVVASGAGPLGYLWRKNGAAITGNASALTSTLSLPHVIVADSGSYDCVVSNAGGSVPSAAATLTVNRAVASIVLGNLNPTFDGTGKHATATTTPAGLSVFFIYDNGTGLPVTVGSHSVFAMVNDPNYTGSVTGTLVIAPAGASVALEDLTQIYDGTPKAVTATTSPGGLSTTVTYNGDVTPPTYPGTYTVTASVTGGGYSGTVTDALVITTLAVVRHASTLSGGVDGSIQVLTPEAVGVDSNGWVSGDLLVSGSPTVRTDGQLGFGGTMDATGAELPSNYEVTLAGNTVLRHLVRRVDPMEMPAVAAPAEPTGTRDVIYGNSPAGPGDFATLRDLTLNGNGQIAVPPGNYGTFTANGKTGFTLGVPGGTQPVVYNLQGFALHDASRLVVVGPVILTVGSSVAVGGSGAGNVDHPEWLRLNVANGGLTLNPNVALHGFVVAPAGTVTIDTGSSLSGGVMADALVLRTNGVLNTLDP